VKAPTPPASAAWSFNFLTTAQFVSVTQEDTTGFSRVEFQLSGILSTHDKDRS
jgi:hypothetical protein